jgi:hypothetical protein
MIGISSKPCRERIVPGDSEPGRSGLTWRFPGIDTDDFQFAHRQVVLAHWRTGARRENKFVVPTEPCPSPQAG